MPGAGPALCRNYLRPGRTLPQAPPRPVLIRPSAQRGRGQAGRGSYPHSLRARRSFGYSVSVPSNMADMSNPMLTANVTRPSSSGASNAVETVWVRPGMTVE